MAGYIIKVNDRDMRDDDCIENYLEFKDEKPKVVANRYIEDMTRKYGDYRKVSVLKRKIAK